MAASSDTTSTSIDQDGSVRRRNVYSKANGGTVYKVDAEDTKKLQKVSLLKLTIYSGASFLDSRSNIFAVSKWVRGFLGRVGISARSTALYNIIIFYSDVEDRSIANSDMG